LLCERQELSLAVALTRVEGNLNRLETPCAKRLRELAKRRRGVVRDAEPPDPSALLLLEQPRELLPPPREVVDLLDLDAVEPVELTRELLPALRGRLRPDLRGDLDLVAAAGEGGGQRGLGAVVHRGRVEHAHPGLDRRIDEPAGERRVRVERVPRPEPHDRPEPALLERAGARGRRPPDPPG